MSKLTTEKPLDIDLADIVDRESRQREQAITELRLKYEGRTIGKDDKESYELVRVGIRELVSLRSSIEKRRVSLGADALNWKRRVDSEAKRLTTLVEEIEEPLRAAKQLVDDEKARIRREQEEAERAAIEANIRLEREAEEARHRAENEAIEERHRIERAKLDEERAILAAQRSEIEAQQRAESERLEKERQALATEQHRLEREEFERQAKARAEQEARERVQREQEQAELRRLETERRQAKERQRIEVMKPDKDKLRSFAMFIKATLPVPVVKSKEAKAVLSRALDDIKRIVADLESFANP